jgi:putative DNA primase/helicase
MDAKMERPELRSFANNPLEKVLRDRGLYLWAALTVVRAYQVAGRPGVLSGIGDTFGEWSDNVRSALVWLGYDDPVLSMEAVRHEDPSRRNRRRVFQAIFNAYSGKGRTAAEMIADAKAGAIKEPGKDILDRKGSRLAEELKEALVQYIGERLDAQYLGNKLSRDNGDITDGLRLCSAYDSHRKVNTWFVEPME